VLDDRDRARVRVLCEGDDYRLAAWIDRDELASVAVRDAVLVPAGHAVPATIAADAVGARVPGGEIVDRSADGIVTIDGSFVRVRGVMAAGVIGVVYREPAEVERAQPDTEVIGTVDLLDAPKGAPFARLGHDPEIGNIVGVRRLECRPDGWCKVRYDDDKLIVIGWVHERGLRTRIFDDGTVGGAMGFGSGGKRTHPVEVKRGTVFVDESGRIPIGIMLKTETLERTATSTDADPHFSLDACGGPLVVRPRR
jgi:hypothetical protein